jgi:hypothetical protein
MIRGMARVLKLVALAVGIAVVAAPAFAAPPTSPGGGAAKGPPGNAKAYGRYCKDQSRKHVEGEKGTPFSQCVTAMAKLAHGVTDSPRKACKALSRKHSRGEKGTPFSRCVAAGARLLADQSGSD